MSDIGRKREFNQDSFYYSKLNDEKCFAFVCDGMGGVQGGGIASELVKELFCEKIPKQLENVSSYEEIRELIFMCYEEANEKIFKKAALHDGLKGMGTTCLTVVMQKDDLMVFNVGDSRGYISSDNLFKQLTVDHSYVQTLVDCGKITKEQAKFHPRKNEITKAVGITEKIKTDFRIFKIKKNDVVLLCTDGLTNSCSDEQIKNIIKSEEDVVDGVKRLVEVANFHGGYDNITAVLMKI